MGDSVPVPGPPGAIMSASLSASFTLVGVTHFVTKPSLWKKVLYPCLISLVSTAVSLTSFLIFLLKPQVKFLHLNFGWPTALAWMSAILLVLGEVAIVNIIVFFALFGCTQSEILRDVLEERGILQQLRIESINAELREPNCCRDFWHTLLFLSGRLPLLIITLPLHGFPVVGQLVWCLLNGWLYTWEIIAEFMVMAENRRHCREQWRFVRRRFGAFTAFGAAAMGLELVPFFGHWIFFASNACGAAFLAEQFFAENHIRDGTLWRRAVLMMNNSLPSAPSP